MPPVAFNKLTISDVDTFVFTTGAGKNKCLILAYHNVGNDPAASVVYNGVDNFTLIDSQANGAEAFVELWAMLNPTQTAGNIVIAGTAGDDSFACVQFDNVFAIGNDNKGSNFSTAISIIVSDVGDRDLVFAGCTHRTNEAGTLTNGTDERYDRAIPGADRRMLGGENAGGDQLRWVFSTSRQNSIVAVNLEAFPPRRSLPLFY